MSKITYTDKEYIYENTSIPAINKITDDDMNEIKSVVNENDTRLTTVEAVIGNEPDTYSTSSTYALGNLVIYGGLLYKCTTAITIAEAWTSGHWTQINLVNAIAQFGKTQLWNGSINTGNATLSSAYTNYDYILFVIRTNGGSSGTGTLLIPVSSLTLNQECNIFCFQSSAVYGSVTGSFTSSTVFTIARTATGTWAEPVLTKIYGIKL